MQDDPKKLRLSAMKFAEEAYSKVKNNRSYALTPQAKVGLAALARAMFEKRIAEGRSESDKPTSWQEFFDIIEKINRAGANLLQKRPGDPKPPPKPWVDPVTGVALPNPWLTKDLKAQTLLQQRDPDLAEHYKTMASDSLASVGGSEGSVLTDHRPSP